jgi:serine protease Do
MEEEYSKDLLVAKIILISVFVTLLIMGGLLYSLRNQIAQYILSNQEQTIVSAVTTKTTSESVISAVATVNPSVVSVIITKDVPVYEKYYETISPWGFFGNIVVPRVREQGTKEQEVGGGSGFVVADRLIVTNQHVVADIEAKYSIITNSGESYPVTILAIDQDLDIAILKIDDEFSPELPEVSFGDSSALQLGETVIAIGNALAEYQNSVSVGVVSGLSRSIVASDASGGTEQLHEVIQTDAAINLGNSGGPLLNLRGEVIGVNVATTRGADNIGFAIPSILVSQIVNSVRTHGEIVRPFLGVRYVTITPHMATVNNLPVEHGAWVVADEATGEPAVVAGSPADLVGIVEGDIIIAVNGMGLQKNDLATLLRTMPVEEAISIETIRDGEYIVKEVTLSKTD